MKKIFLPFLFISVMLTGCLENVQEVTIHEDGSGNVNTTSDMGAVMAMVKQMAVEGMEKLDGQKVDTVFSLAQGADSIPGLNDEEKQLITKGTMSMKMDLANEQFNMGAHFPFQHLSDIEKINKLSNKVMIELIKSRADDEEGAEDNAMAGMPELSSFDNYFITTYRTGVIEKKLDKEKYAAADKDEFLNGVRQTAAMGLTMKTTYIFNLPRPATKAEGKGVTLSEDKKKVTVVGDIDNFFDDPGAFEFKIEY